MGTPQNMLAQDLCTHWSSTYHMLSRLLGQICPVSAALSDPSLTPRGKLHHLDLTSEQWNMTEELSQALEPFERPTVFLSGEQYLTRSVLPHLVQSLKKSIQSSAFGTSSARSFRGHMIGQIT